ncbi:unnamed protein product [Bursaphelenchus okinawaensis]|uniref:ornithine decarboxylase n=1 Tax=Bursaphelenchus okinawaensis TaxID=465554 RepID=A0A811L7W1_9BILA|nr:unnamed protein product [Bursaphelenchus okinawaensis]CAG9118804.1 unnamed protein product [Bursaphelenchus okinawaensis]
MDNVKMISQIDRKVTVTENIYSTTKLAQELALAKTLKDDDSPFMVLNLTEVLNRYTEWTKRLARVEPYYAVKCNNDPVLLWFLSKLGCGFDCASKAEMEMILNNKLADPKHVIYANPCKTRSYVQHANDVGVKKMTFDNKEELYKIKSLHASPQLLLRIGVSDSTAVCQLSVKFGCDPEVGPELLKLAKEMDIEVFGIAFHVGSGCRDPVSFRRALKAAKDLFDVGNSYGHTMNLLDIGGGFPGYDSEEITFKQIADVINPSLDIYFPPSSHVRIIAEPGRFFATHPVSLVANIISAVEVPIEKITSQKGADKSGMAYYINDGVYGSFNCILFDHYHPKGGSLFEMETEKTKCNVWGPTCDGLDLVETNVELSKMTVGDWILYPNMGAYTNVASSRFNGFEPPKVYHFVDKNTWNLLDHKARFGA